MMKNARRGKNWDGAEKEVMGKRSAKEPANFAVSSNVPCVLKYL